MPRSHQLRNMVPLLLTQRVAAVPRLSSSAHTSCLLPSQHLATYCHRHLQSSVRAAAAAAAAATPPSPSSASAPLASQAATAAPPQTDPQSHAAVTQLVAARGLDADPALVSQEAHLTVSYLSSQHQQQRGGDGGGVLLPPQLQDARSLTEHALQLTDLLATGSTFRTLQMLKRHPALLHLSTHEVS